MTVGDFNDSTVNKEKDVIISDKNCDDANGTSVHKVKLSLCLN